MKSKKKKKKKSKKKKKKKKKSKKKKKKKTNMKSPVTADTLIGGRFAPTLHAVKLMHAIKEDPPEIPCKAQAEALHECISEDCYDCFVDIHDDMVDVTTCAEAKSFCKDAESCMTGPCKEPDCSAKLEAVETCVAEHSLDPCPDVCQSEYL